MQGSSSSHPHVGPNDHDITNSKQVLDLMHLGAGDREEILHDASFHRILPEKLWRYMR
jgi:hypothetical protein